MVALRSLVVVLVMLLVCSPNARAQEGEQEEGAERVAPAPSVSPRRERAPSLVPPLIVTGSGAVTVVFSGVLIALENACFNCFSLLGEDYEEYEHVRERHLAPRVLASVGGGVALVGVVWLLARRRARRDFRAQQRMMSVSPILAPAHAHYGLSLTGNF